MSTITFDILSYMSGLTGFVFDKDVLMRIAHDRNVIDVVDYSELTQRDKDLLKADLLLTAYFSPNTWASFQQSHGSYSKGIGTQTINVETKKQIYDYLVGIYSKYEDEKLDELTGNSSIVSFIDM